MVRVVVGVAGFCYRIRLLRLAEVCCFLEVRMALAFA